MPELPDVEVLRRYLEATALHREITAVEVRDADLLSGVSAPRLRRELTGRSLGGARRHGKWLFADVRGTSWLVLHFGMTGRLEYSKDEERIPAHTRLLLRMTDGYHLAYDCTRKLGEVAFTEDPEHFADRHGLGPDALGLPVDRFHRLLEGRRGTVKGLLMDQGALAGIGNVYADDILFQAKLHPRRPIADLDRNDRRRLANQVQRVLRMAIERGADPAAYPDTWLTTRREPDLSCPRCGTGIRKIRVSGRPTYLCPGCQPAP